MYEVKDSLLFIAFIYSCVMEKFAVEMDEQFKEVKYQVKTASTCSCGGEIGARGNIMWCDKCGTKETEKK